ncbi:cellulase family glycosylhydrolase [Thermobifida halotolerans]|uniref:Endoglucanase n=2 Tax=Thermobifida halotolerans TaxID=483545 RepID=A0AA97M2G1_9ACTN|nr:cellulase family glycosylhydrolase [Thermobifida halotolerans]
MKRIRVGAVAAALAATALVPLAPSPALAADGDDWLHTDGNRIVDAAGNEVWLTGANWFGFNTSERVFHGLWAANIEDVTRAMAERGINIVRVPVSTQLLLEWRDGQAAPSGVNEYVNPELTGMSNLEVFDYWLQLCEKYGLKVMLDVHSAEADNSGHVYPVWYKGDITTEDLYVAWEWITERYRNNDTIVAADIKNEPHGKADEDPRAKWDGSTDVDNFKHVCETAGNRILAINPNMLILCEGIEVYPEDGQNWSSTDSRDYHSTWWGGNLRGVADHPVDLGAHQDQLVYSPHDYGPSVFQQEWFEGEWNKQTLTEDVWRPNWLYIHEDDTAPLLIGEWGGFLDGGDNEKWMEALRSLIVEERLHHTFWALNPNSGDTGGLLGYDWVTWDEQKYAFLEPALWQHDNKFVGLDHQVPLGGSGSTTGLSLNQYYGDAPTDPPTDPTDPPTDPTDPPTDPSGELQVQYRNNSLSTDDNQIGPGLRLVNTGGTTVDLADVEIRYYFSNESGGALRYSCDWAQASCSNVSASFGSLSAPGADSYLALTLSGSLAPGASTEVQGRVHTSNWANFDESDDYSRSADTEWTVTGTVTAHIGGTVVWGAPPA